MNIKDMKEKINSKEYDILRNKKELGNNIILLTTGGSYAYGTDIHTDKHESDFDVRGVCLNTYEEILTMNCMDKPYEELEGKGINTYREKDRNLLLDIRNSIYSYDKIFLMVDKLEKDFEYAYKNTSLPKQADINKINELTMEINKKVITSFRK